MTAARKYLASKTSPRKVRPNAYVAINCLLLTKASGTPRNGDPLPQEDVEAYIAALKDQIEASVPLPPERSKLLSRFDVAAWRRLASAHRGSLRYRIYRTNEDLMLVAVGIFEQNGPYVPNRREGIITGEEADVGRSPNWYHFSYTYGELLENPAAALSGLLEKLTVALERYHKMLSHMRGEYWSLASRLKKAQVIRLDRSVDEDAREESLRVMQDQLLDVYSEWKRTGERKLLEQIRGLTREIRQLSPDFQFSLPTGGA